MSVTESVRKAQQWWQTTGQQELATLQRANTVVASFEKDLQDLRTDEKESGFFVGTIKKLWHRATIVPDIEQDRGKAVARRDEVVTRLQNAAAGQADDIMRAVAKDNPALARSIDDIESRRIPQQQTQTALQAILQKTEELQGSIADAREETKEAINSEILDMGVNNMFTTMISDDETRDAVRHLRGVGKDIKEYKAFVEKSVGNLSSLQLADLRADKIAKIADSDMLWGITGIDVLSLMSSWENGNNLQAADIRLSGLEDSIDTIHKGLTKNIKENAGNLETSERQYRDLRERTVDGLDLPKEFYDHLPVAATTRQDLKAAPAAAI
ncbi:MAG: hypothetical protein DI551_02760 [Micavibrio aeruginosavorus]|uniref:Uncharacterized protein n=1 Tax=Micavibrio aeruginosavorus TaxID=349221 RepID=A0A2W5N2G4_9BACT|nr:MAG: hypothetical protein DI551_02760 [Micavibrio aeruginosavorus]